MLRQTKMKKSVKLVKKLNIQIQTISGYMTPTKNIKTNPHLDDSFFHLGLHQVRSHPYYLMGKFEQ